MTRSPLLVFVLLLLTALLPAQYTGEGSAAHRVRSWFNPSQANQHSIESVQAQPTANPDECELYMAARATQASALLISMWVYNFVTSTLVRQAYFDAATQPGDQWVTVLPGGIWACVYNAGNIVLCSRPNTTSNWVRLGIVLGLIANFYSPQLYAVAGQVLLAGCTPAPNARAWSYVLDLQTRTASNGRSFGPQLGAPGNRLECAVPLVDPVSLAFLGWFLLERAQLGLQQRLYHTSAESGVGPFHAVMDSPTENLLLGMSLLRASTCLIACLGPLPISQFPNCVLALDLNLLSDRRVPASGGPVSIALACPWPGAANPPGIAFVAIGFLGSQGIAIPGIGGRLGLIPGQLLVLGPLAPSGGIAKWGLVVPPLPGGCLFHMQGLFLYQLAVAAYFSNTAMLDCRM